LTRSIKSIFEKKNFHEADQRYIDFGHGNAANTGLKHTGQIILPMADERDITAQTGSGLETIPTDVLGILNPLRNNLVLKKLGATIFTGLKGNVQLPDYTGATVGW
jgi:hypothetical protein